MKEQPFAGPGDWVECPVSGADFQIAPHHPKVELEGRVYRVCCSGCAKKFEADPTRFLAAQCR